MDSNSPLQISQLKVQRDAVGGAAGTKRKTRALAGERDNGITGLEETYRAAREEHAREAGSHWCDVPQQKIWLGVLLLLEQRCNP